MRAMLLDAPGKPLRAAEIAEPEPGAGELLLRVNACAVCRTDLHIVDGELTRPKLPLVLGHMIAAEVVGDGRRVGVPWLGWTDRDCGYCRAGLENLCEHAQFTGYDRDGGFAEYAAADERFCFALPDGYTDLDVAPLLRLGRVGHVEDQLGVARLLERRLEGLHQLVRQPADEADRVGYQEAHAVVLERPRGRVERLEERIVDGDAGVGQRVHQARLAGVRVAGQRDAGQVGRQPALPHHVA